MLRWALARVPMRKAEKERLEREEFEAKGYIANLERLLLTADGSPNGRFASRLAGLLAGTLGIPITILPLTAAGKRKAKQSSKEERSETGERVEEAVKAAVEDSKRTQSGEPAEVEVTIRKDDVPSEEAVAKEAAKGHDLLLLGFEHTRAKDEGFHRDIAGIVSAFERPLAIVAGTGVHLQQPERSALRILVPVNGSEVSRRAAEIAIAIARACGCPITVLYVATAGAGNGRTRKRGGLRANRQEQAILKEIVEIADRYDVTTRTAMHADMPPDEAILSEAKKSEHNLIIIGVSRRPGDKLFFGETAAGVYKRSPTSVVFVAS